MNSPTSREYIKARISILGSAFNRKTNSELISIFQRHLERFSVPILQKAFDKAESELERFPTPRKLMEIAANLEPSPLWKYTYQDIKATDPETGAIVNAKRDPVTGETLYRACDCPEGREFLATLKSLARPNSKSHDTGLGKKSSKGAGNKGLSSSTTDSREGCGLDRGDR